MKTYSDNVVSRDTITQIDEKQTREIENLRVLLAASFVANIAITVGLYLFG